MSGRSIRTALVVMAPGGVLLASALPYGGGDRAAWNGCLMALGFAGLVYAIAAPRREQAPRLDRALALALALVFAWVALQLVPLPLPVLQRVSPGRAELTRALALARPQAFAPISIMPERTFAWLLRMGAFVLLYLLVREAGWRLGDRVWLAAIPLMAVGLVEAAAGLRQAYGRPPAAAVVGTYLNRDLYGGLMEMLIPFPALSLVLALKRRMALAAGAGMLLAVMALALIDSLSRMAVACSVVGLGLVAARRRWLALAVVGAFVLGAWAVAPRLMTRYAELGQSGFDANRLPIWKETLRQIGDYPLTGCGLGCRKSAYLAYKAELPLFSVDYAHSDYLQAMAELGIPGFLAALAAAGLLFREALRAARTRQDLGARCLALACVASMVGIALHSLVDFNLQEPSSMLVLAWIAGLGSAIYVAQEKRV